MNIDVGIIIALLAFVISLFSLFQAAKSAALANTIGMRHADEIAKLQKEIKKLRNTNPDYADQRTAPVPAFGGMR